MRARPANAAGIALHDARRRLLDRRYRRRGLAKAYAALRDARALQTFEQAVAANPGNLPLRVEFAEYLWDTRRFDRGNAEMEKVIRDAPGNPKLRAHYGMSLASQSRFAQARKAIASKTK